MASKNQEDEELNNYLARIDEVTSILRGMSSGDANKAEEATRKADLFLSGKGGGPTTVDEDKCFVKNDRTLINKKAFQDMDKPQQMSQESFMQSVEKDADERAQRRRECREAAAILKQKAAEAFKKEDYTKALHLYNKAVEHVKDSSAIYTDRASTCLKLGLWSMAIDDCNTALKLAPDSYRALLYKANATAQIGKMNESESAIAEARSKHPQKAIEIADYQSKFMRKEKK